MKDQVPTRIGLPPGLGSLKDGAPSEVRHMYLRIGHLQELGSDKDEVPIRIGSLQSKALTKIIFQQGEGSKRSGLKKDWAPTRVRLLSGLGSLKDCPPSRARHMYLRIGHLQELGSDKDQASTRSGLKKDWAPSRVRV